MPTIPNRSDDLARPRSRNGKEREYEVTKAAAGSVTIPEPADHWEHIARMLWDSAHDSGVSDFYESTDWATLYLLCDSIHHWGQQGGRRSPELLRVIMAGLGALMFTEGDRRKLRVELEKPQPVASWEAEIVRLQETLSKPA